MHRLRGILIWRLGGAVLVLLVGLGLWSATWPTPLYSAWQMRGLNPAVIATTTACLQGGTQQQACRRLQARLIKRVNDLRPADIRPVQALAPLPAPLPMAAPVWTLWHLAHWPAHWSRLMMHCYDLGEIEDRAPPSVEARYQACNSLVQLAGQQQLRQP